MSRPPRHSGRVGAIVLIVVLCWLVSPTARAAGDSFGVGAFSSELSEAQAGGHPDVTTSITLKNEVVGNPIQQLKDVEVELPRGLSGDPQATPQCSARQLQTLKCPLDSQVGVIEPFFVIACRGVATTLGSEGIIGAAPTILGEAAGAAATELVVGSTAGVEGGDVLTVGSAGSAIQVTVSSVVDSTHLRLTYSIGTAFPAGTPVGDDVIRVADTEHLCGGENNEITVGEGSGAEVAHIAYVLSPTRLELEEPLQNPHALGEPVTHMAEVQTAPLPIYNLEPTRGHLATLGASILLGSIVIQLDAREGGAGIDASISDLSTLFGIDGARFTLWGVPAASSHDSQRCTLLGGECAASTAEPRPFISAPTQCEEPLETGVSIDSWQEPERVITASSSQPAPTGCGLLSFAPTLSITPDTTTADSPVGYTATIELPPPSEALGLATPALRSLSVSLPPGASLSPAGAAGLPVCTRGQFEAGSCPAASAVASVSLVSPAFSAPLPGKLYLAAPTSGAPYGLFMLAGTEAVSVRQEGRLELDPASGRMTIAFKDLPQLPLEELEVSFPGGPGAPLDNPIACGTATTVSQLISTDGKVASPDSSFVVSGGVGACATPRSFAPQFAAGMTDRRAGASGTFALGIARADGEGDLSTVRVTLPRGLAGNFAAVGQCPEPGAGEGACPGAAAIGTTQVTVGAGGEPLALPGTVYLTGPYHGAPYGLSIVVRAVAGPFDLGRIVVRGRVMVDPHTLRVTVATDPLPRIVGGVPVRIRSIHLLLDRPGLLANPTNCTAGDIEATIGSAEGALSSQSVPFRVSGCAGLAFGPRLRADVDPGASRAGAGLTIVARAGSGPQANLSSLTLRLPRQLHPRLSAIRRACPAAVYSTRPGDCPAASAVGRLVVSSPLLGSRLAGDAFLVARGGTAPPAVISSVQAGGLSLELEGRVELDSRGIAKLVFPRLPDVPVKTIQLTLPRTRNSILGATAGLCAGPRPNVGLRAEAQNGARTARTVAVSVGGCRPVSQGLSAVPSR